jgi:hypothetical protein
LLSYISSPSGPTKKIRSTVITPDESVRRAIILSLHNLPVSQIPKGPDGLFLEPYLGVFRAAVEMKFMRYADHQLSLTEEGFLFRDLICWSLFSNEVLASHAQLACEYPHYQRYLAVTPRTTTACSSRET